MVDEQGLTAVVDVAGMWINAHKPMNLRTQKLRFSHSEVGKSLPKSTTFKCISRWQLDFVKGCFSENLHRSGREGLDKAFVT